MALCIATQGKLANVNFNLLWVEIMEEQVSLVIWKMLFRLKDASEFNFW